MVLSTIALLVALGGASPAYAQIYVDADNTSGTEDGASWSTAYTDLQDALTEADGTDEIWIAAGTYTPSRRLDAGDVRTATFEITGDQDGLAIHGGFDGTETSRSERDPAANEVILSGDLNGDDGPDSDGDGRADFGRGENAYHVVVFNGGTEIGSVVNANVTSSTVLDGVTVTGGNASGLFPDNSGGGMYCDGRNLANACRPTLTEVAFIGNTASARGGAIYNNGTEGESSPVITNAAFIGNVANSAGGAIYNYGEYGDSSPRITNALFIGNAADQGGAIYNDGANGLSRPEITNATFTSNTADNDGTIYNDGTNGSSRPEITNGILWENNAFNGEGIFNNDATAVLRHTLIEGGVNGSGVEGDANTDDGNNLDADPLFADESDPAGADGIFGTEDDGLRLTSGSPALDVGTNAPFEPGGIAENVTTDLIGASRIQNGTGAGAVAVDLGAYERAAPVQPDQALTLGGTDDYVRADGVSDALVGAGTLTMEAWVYPTESAGQQGITTFHTDTGGNRNLLLYRDGQFQYYDDNTGYVASRNAFPAGQWYHVALTIDASDSATLYVNGRREATLTTSVRPESGGLFSIGQEWDGGPTASDFFEGRVDEVRIWSQARTQAQLQQGMTTSLGEANTLGDTFDLTDLVAHYRFEGNVLDETGTANGIAEGGPTYTDDVAQATAEDALIVRVNADGSSGAGNGTSWTDAHAALQDGLAGTGPENEIWIAEGTYTPTRRLDAGDARTATFEITGAQDGLTIYGGFAGTETARSERNPSANETILSGDIGTTGDAADNSYHVLVFNGGDRISENSDDNVTTDTVLDGFTITGGNADASFPNNAGGGLYCDGSGSGNVCSPQITNATFTGNSADFGGAIYNFGAEGESSPQITGTIFTDNSVSDSGGALYFAGDRGSIAAQVTNSIFANNGADHVSFDDGDAGEQPRFVNSTFTGATDFAFDVHFYDSGQTPITVVNSVLWDNGGVAGTSQSVADPDAAVAVTYSIVEEARFAEGSGDANAGPGNINEDPLFADAGDPAGPDGMLGTADDGLRLEPGSPALNAGDNSAIPAGITTDLIGEDRIQGGTVSLGAYERGNFTEGPLFFVNESASGGDGSSFANGLSDLQYALDVATAGDVILIAAGTYTPSARLNASAPRTATFEVTGEQDGLNIYGGWSGSETFADVSEVDAALDSRDLVANETILSGNINGDESDDSGNAYHVLVLNGGDAIGADVDANLTPDTVLDGVTITGGNADVFGFPRGAGGGLYCDGQGSGNACSPSLTGLTFAGNSAAIRGGAIYNNGRDSGTSSPQIVNTIFTGNSADSQGGAIYNGGFSGTSSPVVTNATFTGNSAGNRGGAIYNVGRNGTSSPVVTNTILWGNDANDGNEIYNRDATPTLAHTLIEAGLAGISDNDGSSTTDGGNNLDADPLFVDAAAGDVRLTAGSPAIARGTYAPFESGGIAEGVTTDLAGEDRRFGAKPDLGAFTFNDIVATSSDIADATGLLGYLEPTGFEGLLLLRENSASSGGLTLTRTGEAPDDPSGELPGNVAPFTWTVTSDLDTDPRYDLLLSTEDLGGISDFSALMLYKSDDGGQTWNAVDTFSGASLVLGEARALVAVQDLVGFSQFVIASTDPSNPLPVELTGFDARRSGTEAVTLQWQTLSETNNAGFEVQRAAGSTWASIATLDGAGTTDTPQSYRFEDRQLPYAADSLSYRLRQTDTDGTESFSEVVTIARPVRQAELLPTYPNPARSQATVRFAVPEQQPVRINLYDMLGRRVQTVVSADAEGRTEQTLDVSGLASGTYFLRMQTASYTVTQRITVVR